MAHDTSAAALLAKSRQDGAQAELPYSKGRSLNAVRRKKRRPSAREPHAISTLPEVNSTYSLCLKNCVFYARHGVYEQEAELGQRFFIDVTMDVEAPMAVENDDANLTVHYGVAYDIVAQTVLENRRKLIETLAADIARSLCQWSGQIRKVEVAVRKPSAPIAGILDYVEARLVFSP